MHQFSPAVQLRMDEPFYVGTGFCSHDPVVSDKGTFSHVVLENAAGKIRQVAPDLLMVTIIKRIPAGKYSLVGLSGDIEIVMLSKNTQLT